VEEDFVLTGIVGDCAAGAGTGIIMLVA